jgi:hypothetical protein
MASGRSEFFRAQHGYDQVNEAAEGDETDDDVFHGTTGLVLFAGCSAHLVAKANIGGGQDKEPDGEANKNEIVHVIHDTEPYTIRLIKYRAISVKKTLRPM